ncbi:MAG: hypothetical protein QM793_01120 [Muricomes sp.]
MIAKNNEEKRNQIWRTVMTVSTVVIIIIAAFFVIKLFTANPLEGSWSHEDSNLVMTIKGNDTVILEWPGEFEGSDASVTARYSIDRDEKTFTLHIPEDALQQAADSSDGEVTLDGIKSAVNTMAGTYDYNIENNELVLSDREYGEQMVFDKQ